MRLSDRNPVFLNDSDGNRGVGIEFDCPCGCDDRCYVPFDVALDGTTRRSDLPLWTRKGDTFDTLTLTPSIQRILPKRCWHGFVTNGEVLTC